MSAVTSILSLDQVRAHLRMPDQFTADDAMLTSLFIPAAQEAIEFETDYSVPTQFEEYHDGGDYSIWTWHKPILSVELVEEGWGWINFELNYVQVNTINLDNGDPIYAYSIDDPESGEITRRYGANVPAPFMRGESNIRIVYTAGRASVPPVLQLASLELVSHWYQNAMQRAGAGGNAAGYDAVNVDFPHSGADITTTINQGVPYRILEMIKKHRKDPIIG